MSFFICRKIWDGCAAVEIGCQEDFGRNPGRKPETAGTGSGIFPLLMEFSGRKPQKQPVERPVETVDRTQDIENLWRTPAQDIGAFCCGKQEMHTLAGNPVELAGAAGEDPVPLTGETGNFLTAEVEI